MTIFYQELHDALEPLAAPNGRSERSDKLAALIMRQDGYATVYESPAHNDIEPVTWEEQQNLLNGSLGSKEVDLPLQLPLSLVLHIKALRASGSLPHMDDSQEPHPLVSKARFVANLSRAGKARTAYDLLLLEKLAVAKVKSKPAILSLGQEVDWSVVDDSLSLELKRLGRVLEPVNGQPCPLGRIMGGNVRVNRDKDLVPLLCEEGLVVAAGPNEDLRDALSRALYLLIHYNKVCGKYAMNPVLSVGIYAGGEGGRRSLTVIHLAQALPMSEVLDVLPDMWPVKDNDSV